ncbi:hypothetical protein PCANC_12008 [Puccinia coronata f. sp. avenae]|uniref:hAT-like transposase RNase-H fold domain-containing protein n=1 Tax=Puccinia coronata f. sp. avenae TaxID=200324 RepID=A0A2N5UUF8_9BASI|nr:hypothetical protein PCANC_12008 [Puccinia coronata f. sp. avenae]
MAQEMVLIFNQESNKTMGIPNEWDPSAMHVRCACHKLALVVNAGLKALSIITAPKQSVLGFFLVLNRTVEEDEEDELPGSNTNKVNHKGNTDSTEINEVEEDEGEETEYSDEGDTDDDEDGRNESNSDSDDKCAAGDTALQLERATGGLASNAAIPNAPDSSASGALRLQDLTKKLDKVIKIITQSAAQRGNFRRVVEKLKLKKIPTLIAGYGICWNIKYESCKRAIEAKEVINYILREDQEIAQSNQGNKKLNKGSCKRATAAVFDDIIFSPCNWNNMKALNNELEVFVKLTLTFEGDGPTGSHVLPKYLDLKEALEDKIRTS